MQPLLVSGPAQSSQQTGVKRITLETVITSSCVGHTPRRGSNVGDRRPPRCWRSGKDHDVLQESGSAGEGDDRLTDVLRGAKAKIPTPAPPAEVPAAGLAPMLARGDKREPFGGRSGEVWKQDITMKTRITGRGNLTPTWMRESSTRKGSSYNTGCVWRRTS